MWNLIFSAFGFLKNIRAGNIIIYLVIVVCLGYCAFTIKGIYNDIKKIHVENASFKGKIELLKLDLNISRQIAQNNAEAFSDIRKHQDRVFAELDKVEKRGIKLGTDLTTLKERIKDDKDGDIAPVLLNAINGLHKKQTTKADSNNTNRKK